MAQNEITTGYFNLYDSTKNYTELLFRAGKVLQSKELNEIQSTLRQQIQNIGDTILTNGDIIEGCQLTIASNKRSAIVGEGKVYLNGNVYKVQTNTVNINGSGTETIGVILEPTVVTPSQDANLYDVARGYDNYDQDGAYRLKETVRIVANNANASTLYTLVDGEVFVVKATEDLTQLEKINSTLAKRTFDESGNYKVSGLELSSANSGTSDVVNVNLSAGRAYVKGYEIVKDTATLIKLNAPLVTGSISDEGKVFSSSSVVYPLNENYVENISHVHGNVTVTRNLSRSSSGVSYDDFSTGLTPVTAILSITQGSTTYTQDVDYRLSSGQILWLSSGRSPAMGSTYSCTWTYSRDMVQNVDYRLEYADSSKSTANIRFIDGGIKPDNSSMFYVSYSYYLSRIDAIALDKDGLITIIEGQPDRQRSCLIPSVDVTQVLPIGVVRLTPFSYSTQITNNNTKTVSMLEIHNLLQRVFDLEYNQAITDLDQEAAEGEQASNLKGILTDGFIGFTKSDVTHSQYTASLDIENGELTLPCTETDKSLAFNAGASTNTYKSNSMIMNTPTETTVISQTLASKSMYVNSYGVFSRIPVVTLEPSEDNWVDYVATTEDIGIKDNGTVYLNRYWVQCHWRETWYQQQKQLQESLGFYNTSAYYIGYSTSLTSQEKSNTQVIETALQYMRENTIRVTIENLDANENNIIVTFNGTQVATTPTLSAYQGSTVNTLKADSTGKTVCTIKVPEKTPCGTVKVEAYPTESPTYRGTASYTGNSTLQDTHTTVWKEKTTYTWVDPLAQSFSFESDRIISAVGLFFREKSTSEPVVIQIRDVVNGYPGTTEYASKTLYPAAVTTSSNGTAETKVTFDNPVFCEANKEYCVTISTNSDRYSMWVAELGETDVRTSQTISKNAYSTGVLFSSSNARTWTAHQSSDLTFKVYSYTFAPNGTAVFSLISGLSMDKLLLITNPSVPSQCSIKWEYSTNSGSSYSPIEPYEDIEFSNVRNNVTIRAKLKGTTTVSPVISSESLLIASFANILTGTYVSRNFYVSGGYNNIKVMFDAYIPSGASVTVYYAIDSTGTSWTAMSLSGSPVQKNSTYYTYTYEKSLGQLIYNYRVKIVLTTNSQVARPRIQALKNILKAV